jgi:3-oxoadipate enol-lactonase
MVGTEDEFTPVEIARSLQHSVPGAELIVVDGAAHLPNLERPTRFNQALERFLGAIPAVVGSEPT